MSKLRQQGFLRTLPRPLLSRDAGGLVRRIEPLPLTVPDLSPSIHRSNVNTPDLTLYTGLRTIKINIYRE